MLNELKREKFGCLTSFSHLNGREKQKIIVGNKPDARIAKFLYCTRINYDKKSRRNTRHPAGYLELENGKKFDLAKQTIRGKSVFLFPNIPEIYILWHRQTLENKIKASVDKMGAKDKFAAAQPIQKFIDSAMHNHSFRQHHVIDLLSALSVSQLEDLAEQFAEPRDGQSGSASPAAA